MYKLELFYNWYPQKQDLKYFLLNKIVKKIIKLSNSHYKLLKIKKQNQYKNWYLSLSFLKLCILIFNDGLFYKYNLVKKPPN